MKVTFQTSLARLRILIVAYSFVILSGCPSQSVFAALSGANSSDSTDKSKIVLYVNQGDNANLKCEITLTEENRSISPNVSWSKVQYISDKSTNTILCESKKSSNDDKYKCSVNREHKRHNQKAKEDSEEEDKSEKKENYLVSELKIEDVDDKDYGNYHCNVDWGSGNPDIRDFELTDMLKVTRRNSDGKIQKGSLIIGDGDVLYLYCNVTPALTDEYKMSWLFLPESDSDEVQTPKNITGDLFHNNAEKSEFSELFKNFNQTNVNTSEFHGVVGPDHRGNFTCSVDLKNSSEAANYDATFPVHFTLRVRVRDSNRIMLPGLILLGEVIAIALFTAFIWRKVDGIEGGVDGDYADSDDEDNNKDKLK